MRGSKLDHLSRRIGAYNLINERLILHERNDLLKHLQLIMRILKRKHDYKFDLA